MVLNSFKKLDYLAIGLSLVAIVLTQTQFRPIYTLFDKPKIETSIDIHQLMIYHNYGRLTLQQYIQVKNLGKAAGTVSKIYYYIQKVDNKFSNHFNKVFAVQAYIDFNGSDEATIYPFFDTY